MKSIAIKIGAGLIVFLMIILSTCYTVDQTQRAVLLRNGAIVSVGQPGIHYKLPWIESVEKIHVTSKLLRLEKLEGYSHDQQAAHYMISVNYQIKADDESVANVYRNYGGEENAVARIVTPNVLKHSKIVIGTFTAQTSVQDRGRLNNEIYQALEAATSETPITITGVNVEDIGFSPEYNASINKRMTAEVEVQTLKQNLEKEKVQAQIAVTQANAKADSQVAIATAEAKAITMRGNAEATAIAARGKALLDNPRIVELTQSERWDGKLPTTVLPTTAVPIINAK